MKTRTMILLGVGAAVAAALYFRRRGATASTRTASPSVMPVGPFAGHEFSAFTEAGGGSLDTPRTAVGIVNVNGEPILVDAHGREVKE